MSKPGDGGAAPLSPVGAVLAASPAALLAGLLVDRGGFFPLTSVGALVVFGALLAALAALGACASRRRGGTSRGQGVPALAARLKGACAPALPFALIGVLYAASIAAHGLSAAALVQAAPWALAALACAVCVGLDARQRRLLLALVAGLGVASAFAGVFLAVGVPSVPGVVNAGRLQFLFQYANAAGAWFACAALLCLGADDPRLRRWATAPLTALLLTQSAGSVLLGAMVAAAGACGRARRARAEGGPAAAGALVDIVALLVQAALAAVTFVMLRLPADPVLAQGAGVAFFLVASLGFPALWPRAARALRAGRRVRTALVLAAAVLAAVALAGVLAAQGRLVQASATFAERVVQARDAAQVLAASPLLGIGPDQWQHVYLTLPGVGYEATLVHCGYLQLGLNAGVLAPLALATALGAAVVRARPRLAGASAALGFLALHSLIDFDLEFAFFAVLAAILVGAAHGASGERP